MEKNLNEILENSELSSISKKNELKELENEEIKLRERKNKLKHEIKILDKGINLIKNEIKKIEEVE